MELVLRRTQSMNTLQEALANWPEKEIEVLSLSINRTELKAVVYVRDKEQGVEFSYRQELPLEAQNYSWIGKALILQNALRPLYKELDKEGYCEEKLKLVFTLDDYAFAECLELPELEQKDLDEALNWEVPEHVPWIKGSYSFQYLVKKSKEMTDSQNSADALADLHQVYIYAVENSCVETVLRATKEFNWELLAITVADTFSLEQDAKQLLQEIEFYEAHYTSEQLEAKRNSFAIVMLAAVAYAQGRLKINFLPKEDKYRVKLGGYKRILQVLTCCFSGLSLVAMVVAYGYHYKEMQKLETIEAREMSMGFWKQRMQKTKLLQTKEQRLSKEISQLQKQRVLWSGLLKDFGRLMPQGVWFTRLQHIEAREAVIDKGLEVVLQGKAQSMDLVTQLIQNLAQSKGLKKVELVTTSSSANAGKRLPKEELVSFTLKAEIKQAQNDIAAKRKEV